MATITVASLVIPQWQYGGSTAKLRIFLQTAFVSSAGIPLQSGAPGGLTFYKDITVTISGTDATIASFTLDSTTDGLDIQSARYSAIFYNSSGDRLKSYDGFSNFKVGASPSSTTWAEIRDLNFDLQANRDQSAYTKDQSDRRYATVGTSGVADPGSGGFMARTGVNVSTARTLTGTANQIAVTNGSGGSGDPVFSLVGPYTPATYTANGVLYGNTAGGLLVTAQGATNAVLQMSAGVPAPTALPIVDRISANPASVTYDQASNVLGFGHSFGSAIPGTPVTINVPVNKILAPFIAAVNNSGEGKLLGYYFELIASGTTQDIEPVRGIYGTVKNTSTGNQKTSAIRVGAHGTGSNASLLVGVDADIHPVAGTNSASSAYGATVEGSTDDVGNAMIVYQGATANPRLLQVHGQIAPIKVGAVFYRAWFGTGSAAGARAFQVLTNAGAEIGFIHQDGSIQSGLAGTQSGSIALAGGTSGLISMLPQAAAGTYNFNLPTGAGTAGQPLLSGGGGAAAMTFGSLSQANVSGLGLVFISTQVASASATIDFTTLDDTYDAYVLVVSSAKPATDDVTAWFRVGTGGGPTYQTTGYVWGYQANVFGAAINIGGTGAGGAATMIQLSETTAGTAVGNATGENWSGEIRFNNPEASDFMEVVYDAQYSRATANQTVGMRGGGRFDTAGAITGIRFMFSTGNIASGRFTLYGRRKS